MYLRIATLLTLVFAAPFAHAAGFPSATYTLGDYALTFADHGKLELKSKGEVVMDGTWSSAGAALTVTDQSGSYSCEKAHATGVYGWKAEGGSVKFTKQKDDCDERIEALDGKTWQRKS